MLALGLRFRGSTMAPRNEAFFPVPATPAQRFFLRFVVTVVASFWLHKIDTTRKSSALQRFLPESGGQLTLGGRDREDRS
jgi:hypothetical protein